MCVIRGNKISLALKVIGHNACKLGLNFTKSILEQNELIYIKNVTNTCLLYELNNCKCIFIL